MRSLPPHDAALLLVIGDSGRRRSPPTIRAVGPLGGPRTPGNCLQPRVRNPATGPSVPQKGVHPRRDGSYPHRRAELPVAVECPRDPSDSARQPPDVPTGRSRAGTWGYGPAPGVLGCRIPPKWGEGWVQARPVASEAHSTGPRAAAALFFPGRKTKISEVGMFFAKAFATRVSSGRISSNGLSWVCSQEDPKFPPPAGAAE